MPPDESGGGGQDEREWKRGDEDRGRRRAMGERTRRAQALDQADQREAEEEEWREEESKREAERQDCDAPEARLLARLALPIPEPECREKEQRRRHDRREARGEDSPEWIERVEESRGDRGGAAPAAPDPQHEQEGGQSLEDRLEDRQGTGRARVHPGQAPRQERVKDRSPRQRGRPQGAMRDFQRAGQAGRVLEHRVNDEGALPHGQRHGQAKHDHQHRRAEDDPCRTGLHRPSRSWLVKAPAYSLRTTVGRALRAPDRARGAPLAGAS